MSAPIRRFRGVCCDANPSSLLSNSKLSLRRQAPNTNVPTSNCYYTWLALLPPTRSHAANHSPSSPTPSLPANLPSRTPHISPPSPPPLHSFPLTQNVFCRLPLHLPSPSPRFLPATLMSLLSSTYFLSSFLKNASRSPVIEAESLMNLRIKLGSRVCGSSCLFCGGFAGLLEKPRSNHARACGVGRGGPCPGKAEALDTAWTTATGP